MSLIGTFAGLLLFGFSINTLTLFAIVLATGIVVDDAIVVLENVERLMAERKLSPKEAAIESMREVTGAIVAIELVLISVFVPVAFLGGLAGRLYQQFAVTVATAVTISGFDRADAHPGAVRAAAQAAAFASRASSARSTAASPGSPARTCAACGSASRARWSGLDALRRRDRDRRASCSARCPSGFVPSEDQGYIIGGVILPDGATLQRTRPRGRRSCSSWSRKNPALSHMFFVSGFDLIGGGIQDQRRRRSSCRSSPGRSATTSAENFAKFVMGKGASLPEGIVLAFNPPPIRGLGTAGGFEV